MGLKVNLSIMPTNPGCYLFKNHKNIILYVGKAKNLKKRVSSYFTKKHTDEKTSVLVSQIQDIDFIITESEVEALILENNLIKKHQPKYNILLKDSKRYAYLQLTEEKFPRVVLARTKQAKGKFFGPFTSAATRDEIHTIIKKYFQLRTCRRLPKRACLRFHIGICPAPCVGNINEKDYSENIKRVEYILKGHTSELIRKLNQDMKQASDNLDFERALILRNQISALEWFDEKQTMERNKRYDEDIINYAVKDGIVYLMLFNIHRGTLINKQEYVFDYDSDFLEKFLVAHYSENPIPKELILPKKIGRAITEFLTQKRSEQISRNITSQVIITIPKIGEKKHLLDLVSANISASFFGEEEALADLKSKLRLQDNPQVIECFDISHLGGTSTVASMVQFRNGIPDKSNYRRFKIRSVSGIDDFRAIAEVVRRRYSRLKRENQQMPDLIVIDGGKGQLSAALSELKPLGINIPIISLAKKFEEVFVPGLSIPLNISKKSKASLLLQRLRDEAHRFAISYNRLLRKKSFEED